MFFNLNNYHYINIMIKANVQLYRNFNVLPRFATFAEILNIAF